MLPVQMPLDFEPVLPATNTVKFAVNCNTVWLARDLVLSGVIYPDPLISVFTSYPIRVIALFAGVNHI